MRTKPLKHMFSLLENKYRLHVSKVAKLINDNNPLADLPTTKVSSQNPPYKHKLYVAAKRKMGTH
jgi:hypothetical protein